MWSWPSIGTNSGPLVRPLAFSAASSGPHRAGGGDGAIGHGHFVVPLERAPVEGYQEPCVGLHGVGLVERDQLGDVGGAGVAKQQQRGVPLPNERVLIEGGEHLAQGIRGGGPGPTGAGGSGLGPAIGGGQAFTVAGQYLASALGLRGGRSVRSVRSADGGQDTIDGPGGERAAGLRRRGYGQVRHVLSDSLRGSRQRPPTDARAPGSEGGHVGGIHQSGGVGQL